MTATTLSATRLFPSPRLTEATTTPLSILDATVARFTPTGAIWVFDRVSNGINEDVFLDHLRSSLMRILSSFPHWAGQLQWSPVQPNGRHTERFHRPMVVYGAESDPGVEWKLVGSWVGDGFPQNSLLSETPLALHDLRDYEGLPGMLVQISLFDDGHAVGVKIAHPLADAQALLVFVHQWAAASKALCDGHSNSKSPMGSPIFDPSQLDACAAGDIDGPAADLAFVTTARQLPLHRYDWWSTPEPGYPPGSSAPLRTPSLRQITLRSIHFPSRIPGLWSTWDLSRPVTYAQLHFTGFELDQLRIIARADPLARPDISRLDALLAHVWAAINRARGYAESSEDVFLDVTLGARSRVSPPLPESFIGSPVFLTHIRAAGSVTSTDRVGETSTKLRETMLRFTPDAMAAMLHDAAHEVAPHRLWQAFLGSRHTLVTSWLRLQLYQVDFSGSGLKPRYVHAVMPKVDGCLQVMDSGVEDGGVDVALYLDKEPMDQLLEDKRLRVCP